MWPETFRGSDFEQDIRHCDEVGNAFFFVHTDVASGRDSGEFIPRVTWVAASREQLVFGAGIGPQWEMLCGIGVPPEGTFIWYGNFTLN